MTSIIKKDSLVFLHMDLYLEDHSLVSSSRPEGKPHIIQMGNGSISETFESYLMHLKPSDKTRFTLKPEDAFGNIQPDLIQFFEPQDFSDGALLEEGAIIEFEQANGSVLPGVLREMNDCSVKVDFNHPLAGKSIRFDIEIVSIDEEPK